MLPGERCCPGRMCRREMLSVVGRATLGAIALGAGLGSTGCTRGDPHREQVIAYQRLARAKMEALLGSAGYTRCCAAMLAEYDAFADRLPTFEDSKNHDQFYNSAPFMLSLYRALRSDFGHGQAMALDLLSQITAEKVRQDYAHNHAVNRFIYARVAKSTLLRDMGESKFSQYKDEPYGWAARIPASDAYLAIDFTRCGLVDWFRDQAVPEIAPIACEGDLIVASYYTGLELVRTKTLADGDDHCDFHYVKGAG